MRLSAADWSAVFIRLDEALDLEPAWRDAWLAARRGAAAVDCG